MNFVNVINLELIFYCPHLGATTSSSSSGGGSKGYNNDWLRGEGPAAHAHEGIRLQDKSGWVAIGETLAEDVSARSQVSHNVKCVLMSNVIPSQVQVRRVDNEAATQWTTNIGEAGAGKFSVGYSVIEVSIDVRTSIILESISHRDRAPSMWVSGCGRLTSRCRLWWLSTQAQGR